MIFPRPLSLVLLCAACSGPTLLFEPPNPDSTQDFEVRVLSADGQPMDPAGFDYRWSSSNIHSPVPADHRVSASLTTKSECWKVQVFEPGGDDPIAKAELFIADAPPQLSVRIEAPQRAGEAGAVADVSSHDPDGGSVELSWSWSMNGEPVGGDLPVLGAEQLRAGELTVTVQATSFEPAPSAQASVSLGEAPPEEPADVGAWEWIPLPDHSPDRDAPRARRGNHVRWLGDLGGGQLLAVQGNDDRHYSSDQGAHWVKVPEVAQPLPTLNPRLVQKPDGGFELHAGGLLKDREPRNQGDLPIELFRGLSPEGPWQPLGLPGDELLELALLPSGRL